MGSPNVMLLKAEATWEGTRFETGPGFPVHAGTARDPDQLRPGVSHGMKILWGCLVSLSLSEEIKQNFFKIKKTRSFKKTEQGPHRIYRTKIITSLHACQDIKVLPPLVHGKIIN